jgi:hypothetical protein
LSERHVEDKYRAYRDAIHHRVCAICLDGADDGTCGLGESPLCAIDEYLPELVETILDVRTNGGGPYALAVDRRICSRCSRRDEDGQCRLRRDGRCALVVYLPLVVEAVAQVERRRLAESA